MRWYLDVLRNYANFSGRARRKEYWMFILFNIIISVIAAIVDSALGTLSMEAGLGLVSGLYSLAVLVPGLAVSARRLHDTGRSGWWMLVALIPIVGGIVFLIFMVKDGEQGMNQFGPSPKYA